MGQSYRIRTELGINKTINVQLDQEFEFLEILSLKLQQEDVYIKSCAEYGVVVGRVTANNGFGLPNARVSIFIPIDSVDESNPIISSIYPYKSPSDINEDGYRYNLLPYEKSYSAHAATGTLPSRLDNLTGSTAVEIYDKYYKFTVKTNDSGDYMIMGVPQGDHTLVMDVDLSDIGEFSLSPQDLIRMGLATEAQVAGNRFRSSNDLNSLPQIINLTKSVEVSPLWGDPELCDIAINRIDFDLRDNANINIQPTAVFMGSIYSTPDSLRVRKNCRPRDNMGNLCQLTTGPGQILAIRQTIFQDEDGNPVLEQYQLEQSGNIIDGSGAWLTELPMNLDYYITNEFGEKVLSYDPTIGIPTKSKYRFKVKWQQPTKLSEQTRRPYYLLPNIKEYGWTGSTFDPLFGDATAQKKLASSYYFGLEWSGYTDGFIGSDYYERLNEVIDCEDTFYQFEFNKVYTPSSLIDEYKKGARGRFIGIKEIDSQDCESTINKFPVNDGFRNFDLIFFVFSILFTVLQVVTLPIILIAHLLIFLYNFFFVVICQLCSLPLIRKLNFCKNLKCDKKDYTIRLPMITYPDCQTCDCKSEITTDSTSTPQLTPTDTAPSGFLTYFSSPQYYVPTWEQYYSIAGNASEDIQSLSLISSQALGGFAALASINDPNRYKLPISQAYNLPSVSVPYANVSQSLPLGERVNLFNQRDNFFLGLNKIKVTFANQSNIGKSHYDNTITVVSTQSYNSGDLLTFVNVSGSTDINYKYSASTVSGITQGISGESYNSTASTSVNVTYATSQYVGSTVTYDLPYGSDNIKYKFPSDIEFYQVVTAITISQAITLWNTGSTQTFPNVLNYPTTIDEYSGGTLSSSPTNVAWVPTGNSDAINPLEFYQEYDTQYILILQRGVDPYSPKYENKYGIGKILGLPNENDVVVTATTRLNIPIQPLSPAYTTTVQQHTNQTYINYQSYFFKPGISGSTVSGENYTGFTTNNTSYYGGLDSITYPATYTITSGTPPKVISKTTNGFYLSSVNSSKYDNAEDTSGLGEMNVYNYQGLISGGFLPEWPGNAVSNSNYYWSKPVLNGLGTALRSITYSTSNLNVLRTDRLPTSDILDGGSWTNNPSILQQNLNFAIYVIGDDGTTLSGPDSNTGASQVTPDLEGLPNSVKVLESFNCESMVGLKCYSGYSSSFGISSSCPESDAVDKGCYMFLRRPLLDLIKDYGTFAEWAYRFRFFYGLCRGVLSQSYVNNWVNGSLYMFPLQVDTYYDKQNKPKDPIYCKDLAYFDKKTINFYYRSSPYRMSDNKFIGRKTEYYGAVNTVNLMFPTTLINLGYKDSFYAEISFDPTTRAYVIPDIDSTSYADTSDLVNLFVISRITNEGFLTQIASFGDNSIDQLFSRPYDSSILSVLSPKKRIDGDLAQLMSINSEIGNINFSPEYYDTSPPTSILGTAKYPVMAVWFSSTTDNLQTKDYLTPGRIDFRSNDNTGYYPYPYGIKSQVVPFYQWELNNTDTIFGNQYNNWATEDTDIVQGKRYQSLDRTDLPSSTPTYFISSNLSTNPNVDDLNKRGYIFSVDSNGNYSSVGVASSKFIVGAPFQFYFGIIKGESALDLFKTKYSISE
jgi:hypothetical protein